MNCIFFKYIDWFDFWDDLIEKAKVEQTDLCSKLESEINSVWDLSMDILEDECTVVDQTIIFVFGRNDQPNESNPDVSWVKTEFVFGFDSRLINVQVDSG